jgi:hypothetical protein
MNRLANENVQMANRQVKLLSIIALREMHMKSTMRYIYTPIRTKKENNTLLVRKDF